MSRFQFVDDHHTTHGVKRLCQVLGLNRSSYYKWRAGRDARAARRDGPDPRLVDTPHTLVAVPDTRGDLLHRLASVEPIGDLYSIILRQLSAANQNVDQSPAASVDEPHRPATERHSNLDCGCRAAQPLPDQLEAATLHPTGDFFHAQRTESA